MSTAPPERGELLPSETRNEYSVEDMELVKQTRTEVDRYRSMDRLIPSPHNIVTVAALEVGRISKVHGHLTSLTIRSPVLHDSWCCKSRPQPSQDILSIHAV